MVSICKFGRIPSSVALVFRRIVSDVSIPLVCASGVAFASLPAVGATYNFAPISFPGSTATVVQDISDNGYVAGYYRIGSADPMAFIERNGIYTTISAFGSNGYAVGVNDSGHVLGYDENTNGYIEANGVLTPIAFPGATSTVVRGINNSDDVVGYYRIGAADPMAFILRNDVYSTLSGFGSNGYATGVNDVGQVVGYDANENSFIETNGTYAAIKFPGSSYTIARGVNNDGDVVGYYRFGAADPMAFILRNGIYSTIEGFGANGYATGVNASGQVVGYDAHLNSFLATPVPEPESYALMLAGLAVMGAAVRRRNPA